jgi:hypothetical protein
MPLTIIVNRQLPVICDHSPAILIRVGSGGAVVTARALRLFGSRTQVTVPRLQRLRRPRCTWNAPFDDQVGA